MSSNKLMIPEATVTPPADPSGVQLYCMDVAGTKQFFALASDGTITQLSPFGGITPSTSANQIFGDGFDGDLNFDGVSTVLGLTPTATTTNYNFDGLGRSCVYYVLNRNIYANNLTIATGAAVKTNGWQVFVKDTLTLTGAAQLCDNGNGGFQPSQGAPGPARSSNWYLSGLAGGLGASAGGAGSGGGASTSTMHIHTATLAAAAAATPGGNCQGGGGGGGFAGGVGGTGGAITAANAANAGPIIPTAQTLTHGRQGPGLTVQMTYGSGGGGGGGGSGGQGAGGGAGGGFVFVAARIIAGSGFIESKGGKGSSGGPGGAVGGGGGGAGGGGGVIARMYMTKTGTVTNVVTGGAGGAGGSGTTGAGTPGAAGGSGIVLSFNLSGDGT